MIWRKANRKKIQWIKAAACVFLILLLGGCWNSRELDTLAIVMGVGIDQSKKSADKVQVTAQIVKPGEMGLEKSGGRAGGDAFWNLEGIGDTVFGAIMDLSSKSSRELFFPHNKMIIFGRDIAEKGVLDYVDYFARDPGNRNTVYILVSDKTAEEVLNVKPELEQIPADTISEMVKVEADASSRELTVELSDFIDRIMSDTTAPVAPMVEISKENDKAIVRMSGTAVFKQGKMVGELNQDQSRGLMWVLGEVRKGVIEVKDRNDDLLAMEIINATSKITPEIKDGKMKIKVDIAEEGNIAEQTGSEDLYDLSVVAFLENKIATAILGEVLDSIDKARKLDADIFGFGEILRKHYPGETESIKASWDELFQMLEVEVNVKATLHLAGKNSSLRMPG